MLKWLVTCIALCGLTFGAVFLLTDPLHLFAQSVIPAVPGFAPKNPPAVNVAPEAVGKEPDKVTIVLDPDNAQTARTSPTVVTGGSIVAVNKQEVPSERQGRILFIARELRPDELKDYPQIDTADKSSAKVFVETLRYIAINTDPLISERPGEAPAHSVDPKYLRRWLEGEPLEAGRVVVVTEKRYFRKLEVGDRVQAGDTLAVVNPVLALDELDIKKEKLRVAVAEIETSVKTKEEAHVRWQSMVEAVKRVPGAYSQEDIRGGKLTWERYQQEEIAKRAAYVQAQRELNASITQLKMHEVRAQISGVVKTIYKSRGDAVKELEPILQLQDHEHLRVEGVMEIQNAGKVMLGDTVLIEPAVADSPRKVLTGHLQEVTCVAVSRGDKPLILSGSEDRTVRIWNAETGEQTVKIEHKSAIRSLACTGKNAEANLAVAGCSDGSVRLFNLDKMEVAKDLPRQHKSSVTCVAFSPNGKVCATGGADHAICLYDTDTGELLFKRGDAHKSPVTSVQFATDDTFVSAAPDNVLNVWKFAKGQAPVVVHTFDKRSGDVTQLGVSPDGQYVLFDDAKDLRILSLQSGQIVGSIQGSEGTGFRGLALFAPDGKTVLTTSAADNRLQLWRTPALGKEVAGDTLGRRAAELRQFTWSTGKENAAAYAPDASFIVTGTQDNQVLVWGMPDKKQIDERLTARVSLVEKSLDASSRQVRIWAEVDNKSGWLIPGGTATIVIPPKK